jgi:signal transduction histidine kinase
MSRAEEDGRAARARFSPLLGIYLGGLLVGAGVASFAVVQLRSTSRNLGEVISQHTDNALEVQRLTTLSERLGRLSRSYLLTGDERFRTELAATRGEFERAHGDLSARVYDGESRRLAALVDQLSAAHERAVDRAMALRQSTASADAVSSVLEREVEPSRDALVRVLSPLGARERQAFEDTRAEALRSARLSLHLLLAATIMGGLIAIALLLLLVSTLRRLIASREQLALALQRLEERNRDLDAFAARVAHDMRNVLMPIRLSAQRILGTEGAGDTIQAAAHRIERSTARSEAWIDSLLAFSRAARSSDPHATASVRAVVAETVEGVATQATQAGVSIETDVEELEVACAAPLLGIVLANLVGNAIKFMEREPRRVSIRARRDGGTCELSVADTGPGIPADVQSKIFDPFYRGPGSQAPGTGLGLATVRRIVEGHGGSIAVVSTMGEGSRFSVRLPLASRPREAVAPGRALPSAQVPAST